MLKYMSCYIHCYEKRFNLELLPVLQVFFSGGVIKGSMQNPISDQKGFLLLIWVPNPSVTLRVLVSKSVP